MATTDPVNGGPVGGSAGSSVDNVSTIEDVLHSVLGYTVGTSGNTSTGTATLDESLRPATIAASGGPWFKPDPRWEHAESNINFRPGTTAGAVTFWRWMQHISAGHVEGMTVHVLNQSTSSDSGSGNNYDPVSADGQDTTDPITKVGSAWYPVATGMKQLVGNDTPFDPRYLGYIQDVLRAVGVWADSFWNTLNSDATSIDTGAANFKGSAAEAFRDVVVDAERGVADVLAQSKNTWNDQLLAAQTAAQHFAKTLLDNAAAWQRGVTAYDANGNATAFDGSPANTWTHPLNLVRNMFEGSVVKEIDGGENYNHSAGLWGVGEIQGGNSQYNDDAGDRAYKIMIIEFPAWSEVAAANGNQDPFFDVMREWTWNSIDKQTRAAWAKRVAKAFEPSLAAAAALVKALDTATGGMVLADIAPPIPPRQPNLNPGDLNIPGLNIPPIDFNIPPINFNIPPIDFNIPPINFNIPPIDFNIPPLDMKNKVGDGNLNLPPGDNLNLPGGNYNPPGLGGSDGSNLNLAGITDNFDKINSDLNDINGYLGGNNANLNTLGNDIKALAGANYGLNSGPNDLLGLGDGPVGDGGVSGLGGGSGDPQTLGDLTGQQLQALQDQGLLNGTPLTDAQRAALDQAGLPADGAQTLGDLSPAQLAALQAAGLLDSVPLTPAEQAGLVSSGLLSPGQGLDSLGDLSPAQLDALQKAGLLDNIPLTDQDLAELTKDGLLGSGTLNDLGDLNPAQLAALQKAGLLDSIPTTPAELSALNKAGLLGATDGSLQNLGDLSPQQLTSIDAAGQLNNTPVTPAELAQLRQDGLLGADASGLHNLGDLSPAQLEDLRSHGLLNPVPVTSAELNTLDQAGLLGTPTGLSNSLGNLTPQQLAGLDSSGLLNQDPITPAQVQQLQHDGLLGTDTSGINSLGDLTPAQLNDLSNHALLDGVPATASQAGALGLNGTTIAPAGPQGLGTTGLEALPQVGGGTAASAFPTTVDGVNVSPIGPSNPGIKVGNLSAPGHTPLHLHGGTSGGGMSGGGISSGGLSLPGLDAGPAKSANHIPHVDATPPGTGAIGGPGSGVGIGAGAPNEAGAGMGGMPFMPMGGMGGMGGGAGGQGSKERERSTWLTEDDDVWGTDPECAPAVVGRGDGESDEEPGFDQEIKPERPGAPKRGSGVRRGR